MLLPVTGPDPATLLAEVPFCVLDLETTGGAPQTDAITEIGAVVVRGGETLRTFQTFVHPGITIPARVSYLTGITDTMVGDAPRPESVLPTLLEFIGDAVIVGHNVRFDLGFLNAALARAGFARITRPSVDTCALARRLVRDEVPECTLGTLARWLRLDHHPTHRALADALATTDLLHALLERVAAYGVFRLDDLLALPTLAGHPYAAKLALTDLLPRSPGVYEFLDRDGTVVYVGKATNVRQRVRSYFGSDDRRTIRPLLGALHSVRHRPAPNSLVAEVTELRLLHAGRPRFNRAGALPSRPTWLTLSTDAFPRLVTSNRPLPAARALGPFPSLAAARRAQEAVETVIPVRRCTERLRSTVPIRLEPCPAAQVGTSCCPCSGGVRLDRYAQLAEAAHQVICGDPTAAVAALTDRMLTLAAAHRFEEAALARDRLRALQLAHRDRLTHAALRAAGRLDVEIDGGTTVIDAGVLSPPAASEEPVLSDVITPAHLAESVVIARWLRRHRERWTLPDRSAATALLAALDRAHQLTVAPSRSIVS